MFWGDTSTALAEKLGLTTPHRMRHTHAPHALQREAKMTTVRGILRHASLSTKSIGFAGQAPSRRQPLCSNVSFMNPPLRVCLREPIPEIEFAAGLLEQAAAAHRSGQHAEARSLLERANIDAVRDWSESLWGKKSRFAPSGPYWSSVAAPTTTHLRMPSLVERNAVHARDGYYCRFCGIPVIRKQVRERLRKLYPDVQIWGKTNKAQHAALQCMWAQYDHLLPHSRGGSNSPDNIVVTCAPCNYGRMQYTLEEAGLMNPLEREPRRGSWTGLEQLLAP